MRVVIRWELVIVIKGRLADVRLSAVGNDRANAAGTPAVAEEAGASSVEYTKHFNISNIHAFKVQV